MGNGFGRREREQAEQVDEGGRIGRREIVDPAEKRRMPHLDRHEQHLVERKEHRNLDHDRQAAGQRVGPDLLVHRHDFLLLARLVVGKALADLHHLRLQELHLAHRRIGFIGEREKRHLDQ